MILALIGLATWRVSSLFVNERGPLAIFERFRRLIGMDKPGPVTEIQQLFSCVWCLSPWVGALFVVLFRFSPVRILAHVLAASAIAVYLEESIKHDQKR